MPPRQSPSSAARARTTSDGVAGDQPQVEQPDRRREVARRRPRGTAAAVRTEWSSRSPASHSGYQSRSASSPTSRRRGPAVVQQHQVEVAGRAGVARAMLADGGQGDPGPGCPGATRRCRRSPGRRPTARPVDGVREPGAHQRVPVRQRRSRRAGGPAPDEPRPDRPDVMPLAPSGLSRPDAAGRASRGRRSRGHRASGPCSPVRTRTTSSTGIGPDLAVADPAGLGALDDHVDHVGRRRRRPRAPRAAPSAPGRRCTPRPGRPRCGRAGGRSRWPR